MWRVSKYVEVFHYMLSITHYVPFWNSPQKLQISVCRPSKYNLIYSLADNRVCVCVNKHVDSWSVYKHH